MFLRTCSFWKSTKAYSELFATEMSDEVERRYFLKGHRQKPLGIPNCFAKILFAGSRLRFHGKIMFFEGQILIDALLVVSGIYRVDVPP